MRQVPKQFKCYRLDVNQVLMGKDFLNFLLPDQFSRILSSTWWLRISVNDPRQRPDTRNTLEDMSYSGGIMLDHDDEEYGALMICALPTWLVIRTPQPKAWNRVTWEPATNLIQNVRRYTAMQLHGNTELAKRFILRIIGAALPRFRVHK